MNKNIQAIYPLTPLQEGILYHIIEMPNSDIYFQQFSCVIEGLENPEKWHESWQNLTQIHPIMRTLFTWENRPQPLQIVRERVTLPWTELNWSEYSSEVQNGKWSSLLQRDRDLNIDLSVAPVMRFSLVKLGENRYNFLFSFHHIVLDGWSQRLLFDQALASYKGYSQTEQTSEYKYSDFIDYLGSQDKQTAELFWTENLAGFKQATNIVNDKSTTDKSVDVNKRKTQELFITTEVLDKLKTQARRHKLTFNSLILGAWSLILASHNRTNDVLFGTTVAGRPSDLPNADKIAGLFINTLPFRAQVRATLKLADWLATLQSSQAACRQFEQTPLTDIHRYSEFDSGTTLFESIIVVENLASAGAGESADKIQIKQRHYAESSHYPLAILVDPSDGLNLIALHQESKVSSARVKDVLNQLHTILLQMSQSLDIQVGDVETLPAAVKQKQLVQWNQTQQHFPEVLPVHMVFEKWAANTPDKTAIIDITGNQEYKFSYAEVNRQANKLAHFLKKNALQENAIVPILLERSANSLISFLAVMKAGAAYIPLDTNQPAQRQAAIISNLQDENLLLISQSSLQDKVPSFTSNTSVPKIIMLDENEEEIANCSDQNLNLPVGLENVAYVIFTSGSTGLPKGVIIEHRALANSTLARDEFYPSSPKMFLLMSPLATDSAIAGIYWTLCSGTTLLLPAKRVEQDIHALGQNIRDYRVTHILCIPSLYQLILENAQIKDLKSLSTIIVAGESCKPSVIRAHQQLLPSAELYNEYGPSEYCVWATATCLSEWQASQDVCIGRPIANTQTYVLDQNLKGVLPEVVGELYIGGNNIARGYLNLKEKTAEVFINNPFADPNIGNNTLYKTGDLVKYTAFGELVFVGRADNQLKVRGFRIEPEEIEYVLSLHPLIEEALVFVETTPVSDTALLDALSALNDEDAKALLSKVEQENPIELNKLGVDL
jgi:microcystin synthetase protein McyB